MLANQKPRTSPIFPNFSQQKNVRSCPKLSDPAFVTKSIPTNNHGLSQAFDTFPENGSLGSTPAARTTPSSVP
jgi:hypothetical protein